MFFNERNRVEEADQIGIAKSHKFKSAIIYALLLLKLGKFCKSSGTSGTIDGAMRKLSST